MTWHRALLAAVAAAVLVPPAYAEPPAPPPPAGPYVVPAPPVAVAAPAAEKPLERDCCGKWSTYGDLRLRFESDWDSHQANGNLRDDRDRFRARARLGVSWEPDDVWKFDIRARTGREDSQQSPHLTFWDLDDGENDDLYGGLDRYYARAKTGASTWWFGRFDFPFWKQNEMFWDDDVTLTGVAHTLECEWECGKAFLTAGAFILPDGMWGWNGHMAGAQFRYEKKGESTTWNYAAGLFAFFGEDGAEYLRNDNGARDYLIGHVGVQAKWTLCKLPAAIGLDLYHNFEDYDADGTDTFAATHRDELTGWVFSVQVGETKERGDWSFAYAYADIETLAVHASYAQDDWVRWGQGGQTDSSDFYGHEVRVSHQLCKNLMVQARLFLAEANTSVQDGKRFRIDFNYKF